MGMLRFEMKEQHLENQKAGLLNFRRENGIGRRTKKEILHSLNEIVEKEEYSSAFSDNRYHVMMNRPPRSYKASRHPLLEKKMK